MTLSVSIPKHVFKVPFPERRNESAGRAVVSFGLAFFSPPILLGTYGTTGMLLFPRRSVYLYKFSCQSRQ